MSITLTIHDNREEAAGKCIVFVLNNGYSKTFTVSGGNAARVGEHHSDSADRGYDVFEVDPESTITISCADQMQWIYHRAIDGGDYEIATVTTAGQKFVYVYAESDL